MRPRLLSFLLVLAVMLAFGAFSWLWCDPRQALLMKNTLWLAAMTAVVSLPWGTVLACLLVRTDLFGRSLYQVILATMLVLPLYLLVAAWDAGFGQLGWFSIHQGFVAFPWLRGWTAAIWIHALAAIPWVVLFVGVALRRVETELEEEGLLSTSPLRVFLTISLPRAAGGASVACLWVLLTTAGEMTVTDVYRIRTFSEELYTGFALGEDLSEAFVTTTPSYLLGAALALLTIFLVITVARQSVATAREPHVFALRRWQTLATLVVGVSLLVIVATPLGNLVYKAGFVAESVNGSSLRYWSLARFAETVFPVVVQQCSEIQWTIAIGAMSATMAILIGFPLVWLARDGGYRAIPAILIIATCLALPGPLIGLGLIRLLDQPNSALAIWLYDRTIFAPTVAQTIRALPIVSLVGWYTIGAVTRDLLEAAKTDGAGFWQRLWSVAIPANRRAMAIAWLLAFAIATGDLACSILVVPPGVNTLAIRVFGLIHYGVDHQVAGICLNAVAGFALIATATLWLVKRVHQ